MSTFSSTRYLDFVLGGDSDKNSNDDDTGKTVKSAHMRKFIEHISTEFSNKARELKQSEELIRSLVACLVQLVGQCLQSLAKLNVVVENINQSKAKAVKDEDNKLTDSVLNEEAKVETEDEQETKRVEDNENIVDASSTGSTPTYDRDLAANVVVTCIERSCRHDCLEVVSRVLEFTPEQRKRVGLDQASGFWSSFIPGFSRGQARAEQASQRDQSFTSAFDDLIRDETS